MAIQKERRSAAPKPPPELAGAEIVMDAATGTILHDKNADKRCDIASLTKLATAYMVLRAVRDKKLDLDQLVTVSAAAAEQKNNGFPDLPAGSKLTVREALGAMVTSSANGLARTLGEALAPPRQGKNGRSLPGTERDFAREMTRVLREEVGMSESTSFINASGLNNGPNDNKCNYSTPRDIARLSQALMKEFPEYGKLMGAPSASATVLMPDGQKQVMQGATVSRFVGARNKNYHAVADAPQKTGTNPLTKGIALVSTAENDQGVRLISVVMESGRDSRYTANDRNLRSSYAKIDADPQLAAAYPKQEKPTLYAARSPSSAFSAASRRDRRKPADVAIAKADDEPKRPHASFNSRAGRRKQHRPAQQMEAVAKADAPARPAVEGVSLAVLDKLRVSLPDGVAFSQHETAAPEGRQPFLTQVVYRPGND